MSSEVTYVLGMGLGNVKNVEKNTFFKVLYQEPAQYGELGRKDIRVK